MIDNTDCYWYWDIDEENPCCLEEIGRKPCYIHVKCYYYFPRDNSDDYIRKLIKENEKLKLMRVELP